METAASGRPRAGPPERATEMGGRKRAPHLGQWSRQEGRVTPGRTRVYSRAYHPVFTTPRPLRRNWGWGSVGDCYRAHQAQSGSCSVNMFSLISGRNDLCSLTPSSRKHSGATTALNNIFLTF